jgi:hypothetical protein
LNTPLGSALFAAVVCLVAPSPAHAADEEPDGVYGRFDGDLDVRLGAGASFAKGGPSLSAFFSALYMSSVGVYAHYTDALSGAGPEVARSIAAGLVVEPLFLGRFATDFEHGPSRFDLALDSFAIGLGAFWAEPRGGRFTAEPGLEFSLGFALPILPRATGPVLGLRGALRVRPAGFGGAEPFNLIDQGALLSVTLAWRHILPVNIVDVSDRVLR